MNSVKSWLLTGICVGLFMVSTDSYQALAMTTKNQKQPAITSIGRIKTINNKNITRKLPKRYSNGYYPESGHINRMRVNGGAKNVHFTTSYFLSHDNSQLWAAPQSAARVGHYVYVMYNLNRSFNDKHDFIVRYDIRKMKNHGIPLLHKNKKAAGIKVGPVFKGGHGQSLSYNPKNKQLWFVNVGRGSAYNASAERVSMRTLRPNYQVKFKFTRNRLLSMDNSLAFDKHGRAYTYVRAGGGDVKVGAYRIYYGKISTSGVHFRVAKHAIRHAAGAIPQGMGYNPKNNRLYFVSDGSIISIPANKVNRFKKHDIHYIHVKTNREFEGLTFNRKGEGLLLVLRPSELMKMSGSF
ncbi:hypothetical protein MOO44_00200 (plasmid) [Nicoliella spurrieriana]|uniref:Extracellular protein n=1 Tax=Nicoliella spurrieriana TaxID=2925830 RepID=A0A976X4S6_9LACO|nr:hypothetical protein [Nicoliella spurrieriana]UQS86100.1 hypothetical protein MOO44_00200 [Nicoliella spurrieriana]